MKKILVILCFLLIPFQAIKATSGSCSLHSGVNCYAGSDWDGSVICNDGWKDSLVRYSDADECSASKYIYIADLDQYNKIINDIRISCNSSKQSTKDFFNNLIQESKQKYLNLANSEKARLLKLGITPSDSAWSNAEAGQLERAATAETTIKNDMDMHLAETENSCLKKELVYIYDPNLYNRVCTSKLGVYSQFNKTKQECECLDGYVFGFDSSSFSLACIKKVICETGFILNNGVCNKLYVNVATEDKNTEKKSEIIATTTNNIKQSINDSDYTVDKNLANKLKGKILLQVELHGEAWYINPSNSKRYYMADGASAYTIMRELSIGISNRDFNKLSIDKIFAKKQAGKIFIKTEDFGEAYYIDNNGNSYYLKNGAEAYSLMKKLGLGIKNSDLNKIEIGQ